jgi:hypothetical protein
MARGSNRWTRWGRRKGITHAPYRALFGEPGV